MVCNSRCVLFQFALSCSLIFLYSGYDLKHTVLWHPSQKALDAILYLPPHIPSGSEQSERIRAESDWFLLNSDHIPTSFLAIKKKVYKSHSEFIPSSFRVIPSHSDQHIGFKKKLFYQVQMQNSDQIPTKFRPNSKWILSPFWVHSESIPSHFQVISKSFLSYAK